MKKNKQPDGMPVWFDGKSINEALFCDEFLQTHKIIFTNGAFFTPEGRVTDELPLRGEIFEELKCCAVSNIPRKISNIVELMKLAALVEDFPLEPDRIHLSNGTLFLDGKFSAGKPEIVRNRFPVAYTPNAPKPVLWLQFLDGLLCPEDIPTLQEYIGYGRRRTEKKLGTRNEMHVVEQDEFPIYEGQHEAIISEEDWNLAQDKRKANAFRREKVIDPEHAHILSGILKCPCCGKSLYGNIAKAHSKDKKTRYYYYCKNTLGATGHKCTFRVNIEQTEMNRMVAAIISAMVNDPQFSKAIKEKIGTSVDTEDLEKQLSTLQAQLRQTLGIKARLERQMDTLDINDPYFDRKILDLQRRYDEQYGRIEEIETQLDEVKSQIQSIRQEKISGDNIYQLLLAFDEVYGAATEIEQKEFMRAFIERIDLYPEKQKDGNWIRNMVFNFPVPVNGQEVTELPLESGTMLETVARLERS